MTILLSPTLGTLILNLRGTMTILLFSETLGTMTILLNLETLGTVTIF